MKLKKIGFALMSLILILTMIPAMTSAASKLSIVVEVNGELVSFPDAKPFMDKSNRVQVPVRFVSEALGAEVGWNSKSKQVTVQMGEDTTVLTMGKKAYTVNGQTKQMDTVAQQKQNRTFVPLRFVSEALGAKVIWHKDLYSVEILTGLAAVQENKEKESESNSSKGSSTSRSIEGETEKKVTEGFSYYQSYKSGLFVNSEYEEYKKEYGKQAIVIQPYISFSREGVNYTQQVKDLEELLSQKIDAKTVQSIMKYVKEKTKRDDVLASKEFSDGTYRIEVASPFWDDVYVAVWYK
ncbi:copper amine oxidase N-terminal domain-containing protein [Paenibacillus motobuensis]|uniref:copper amine oxidase N-terminal domain-containing protein n=1 Tax=Paenibacillus TaxID=44249 RepID=UPI002040D815|nr:MULTISPECIES: copper amine oxidase N-terminal domain-containing protein [Paenibacillus]MCM3042565.1 copper amine oxidase N-terminal domain-containing protein [Paenibacillus lutimineralis]MCM3649669.1 copper amine oxidase N-terminal domain-containing protein [Paenibacillus motobuensis]